MITQFSLIENFNSQKSDLVILGAYQDENKKFKLNSNLKKINEICENSLNSVAELESFEAKLGSLLVLPSLGKLESKRILVIGLGLESELTNLNQIRKATAAAIRKADSLKAETINFEIFGLDSQLNISQITQAIAEVALLAPYKFEKYLSKKEESSKFNGIQTINFIAPSGKTQETQAALKKARIAAEGVLLARELIAEPPNIVNPAYLAQAAQKIVSETPKKEVSLKILEKSDCEKLGMGAFLAVAQGSVNEPKFIHFNYKPQGQAKKHIAFVGKGITFDSGGLSLKPSKAMEKMKYDMAGSAAVIGLMKSICQLELPLEITIIVAACENMPSGSAYRPGDILRSMSGKTIEINNTDAEGRVTLADSVYYACEQKPDAVIDIATLTGAIVVALGESAAGLMTNNAELGDNLKKAFEDAGERVWEMPMYEDYQESVVKGTIADMLNAGSGGQAGSQNGAMFIKQFVGETPWVHLDIAGTCWPEKRDTHFTPKNNPSGFGVLGFLRYLESLT